MKTKFNQILTLFIALLVQVSFAQEKTISGTVSDDSGALPGVSVVVEGTSKGVETDFDGNYSIKANQGDVLTFSYLGYATSKETVGTGNTINVTLQEGSEMLEEITIGLGISKAEKAIGYAVQKVSGENINKAKEPNLYESVVEVVKDIYSRLQDDVAQDLTIDQVREKLSGAGGATSPVAKSGFSSNFSADDVLSNVLDD